jgi:hypothetical protein
MKFPVAFLYSLPDPGGQAQRRHVIRGALMAAAFCLWPLGLAVATPTGAAQGADTVKVLRVLFEDRHILKELNLVAEQPVVLQDLSVDGRQKRGENEPVTIAAGQRVLVRKGSDQTLRVQMVFKRRAALDAYDAQGDYLLEFRRGRFFEATVAQVKLEAVLAETLDRSSLEPSSFKGLFTLVAGKPIRLDATSLPDLRLKMTGESVMLGPFRRATLEVEQPLRTPPQSPFVAEIRKAGWNFADSRFRAFAAARGEDGEGPFHEIRDLEIKETQQGRALLSLRLPPQFAELSGFRMDKWGIPIDLRVVNEREGQGDLLAEYRYYVGSSSWSFVAALALLAVFYLGPLYFLRGQRQPEIRRGRRFDLGLFSLCANPSSRVALGEEADLFPARHRQPLWFSPLWLGRSRRGEARMSSFQITIWTYLVFGVAVYAFLMNGRLIDINQGMLYLLGISGGGSVLARMASARQEERIEVVTAAGGGADRQRVVPAWTNLIMSGGRVDLSRLQILLFTMLTAFYVGITALVTFQFPEVPEGLLTLMGISNGLYVLSKVTEPGLADRLAEADLVRRAAQAERDAKKGQRDQMAERLAEKEARIRRLEADATNAQGDEKARLAGQKRQVEEEMSVLKKQSEEAEGALNAAEKAFTERQTAYQDILAKLNQALDKQAGSVV